jgi:hypothetical protein
MDAAGPHREGEEPKPVMHESEKSDSVVARTRSLSDVSEFLPMFQNSRYLHQNICIKIGRLKGLSFFDADF